MTDRCEPPPEWREKDGWHELRQGHRRAILFWMPESADSDAAYWSAGILIGTQRWTVRSLTKTGWRYVRPVPSPDVLTQVEDAMERAIAPCAGDTDEPFDICPRCGATVGEDCRDEFREQALANLSAALAALRGTP